MWLFLTKTMLAALVISFCSWLSGKRPDLAGFIVSLPLTTILVLLFSQAQFNDSQKSVLFAKSIFLGLPISMMFFVPFLLADTFKMNFWTCFFLGLFFIIIGYWVHKTLLGMIR